MDSKKILFLQIIVDLANIWQLRQCHSSRKVLLLVVAAIMSALWSAFSGGLSVAFTEQECQAAFKYQQKVCAVCLRLMTK